MKVLEMRKVCLKKCGYDKSISVEVLGDEATLDEVMNSKRIKRIKFSSHNHPTHIDKRLLDILK